MMYKNAPGRLPEINTFRSYEIKFADRVRSCEDVLILESRGLAILACDPGRERWNTVMVRLTRELSHSHLFSINLTL